MFTYQPQDVGSGQNPHITCPFLDFDEKALTQFSLGGTHSESFVPLVTEPSAPPKPSAQPTVEETNVSSQPLVLPILSQHQESSVPLTTSQPVPSAPLSQPEDADLQKICNEARNLLEAFLQEAKTYLGSSYVTTWLKNDFKEFSTSAPTIDASPFARRDVNLEQFRQRCAEQWQVLAPHLDRIFSDDELLRYYLGLILDEKEEEGKSAGGITRELNHSLFTSSNMSPAQQLLESYARQHRTTDDRPPEELTRFLFISATGPILWTKLLYEQLPETVRQLREDKEKENKRTRLETFEKIANPLYVQLFKFFAFELKKYWPAEKAEGLMQPLTELYKKFAAWIQKIKQQEIENCTESIPLQPPPINSSVEFPPCSRSYAFFHPTNIQTKYSGGIQDIVEIARQIQCNMNGTDVPLFNIDQIPVLDGDGRRFYIHSNVTDVWQQKPRTETTRRCIVSSICSSVMNFFKPTQKAISYVDYFPSKNLYSIPKADRNLIHAALVFIQANPKNKNMINLSLIKNKEWRKMAIQEALAIQLTPMGVNEKEIRSARAEMARPLAQPRVIVPQSTLKCAYSV